MPVCEERMQGRAMARQVADGAVYGVAKATFSNERRAVGDAGPMAEPGLFGSAAPDCRGALLGRLQVSAYKGDTLGSGADGFFWMARNVRNIAPGIQSWPLHVAQGQSQDGSAT